MYLDLSVLLFSLLQSINTFFHPVRFIGMGEAQFVSILCHKAGETEEKHRMRGNAKKFPSVSFSATTGTFDGWMDGWYECLSLTQSRWCHSRSQHPERCSYRFSEAGRSWMFWSCSSPARLELQEDKCRTECVRSSGEGVHTHTPAPHPSRNWNPPSCLPAANSTQTRASRSRAAAREAMSLLLFWGGEFGSFSRCVSGGEPAGAFIVAQGKVKVKSVLSDWKWGDMLQQTGTCTLPTPAHPRSLMWAVCLCMRVHESRHSSWRFTFCGSGKLSNWLEAFSSPLEEKLSTV